MSYQHPVLQLEVSGKELGIDVNDFVSYLDELSAPCPAARSLWKRVRYQCKWIRLLS